MQMETKTDSGVPLIEKPSESPGQSLGIFWSFWNWLTTKRALTNAQVIRDRDDSWAWNSLVLASVNSLRSLSSLGAP